MARSVQGQPMNSTAAHSLYCGGTRFFRRRFFGQRVRSQFLQQAGEGPDLFRENLSFGGRNPLKLQVAFVHAEYFQDLVRSLDDDLAFFITSQVMAVTDVSAGDHHAVSARFESAQQKPVVHPPGAHQADEPNVGRVLHPCHSGQVCAGVGTPVAHKREELWFE